MTRAALVTFLLLVVIAASGAEGSAAEGSAVFVPFAAGGSRPAGECEPSYPTICLPPPPPDLDCPDIPYKDFVVLPPDPHRLDADKDGIGCESPPRAVPASFFLP